MYSKSQIAKYVAHFSKSKIFSTFSFPKKKLFNLFDADFDILTINERLGHSSVAITFDVYTHQNENRKKKTAKRLHQLKKCPNN